MRGKLANQQIASTKPTPALSTGSNEENTNPQGGSSSDSTLLTPASEGQTQIQTGLQRDDKARAEAFEVARLQLELHKAQDQIARQAHELHSNRVVNQAMAPNLAQDFNAPTSPITHRGNYGGFPRQGWANNDDTKSELSDFNSPSEWTMPPRSGMNFGLAPDPWGLPNNRGFNQRGTPVMVQQEPVQQQRNYSVPSLSPIRSGYGRGMQNSNAPNFVRGFGYPTYGSRNGFPMIFNNSGGGGFGNLAPGPTMQGVATNQGYQPQPIGTPLSAAASNFNPVQASQTANPWNAGVSYVHPCIFLS